MLYFIVFIFSLLLIVSVDVETQQQAEFVHTVTTLSQPRSWDLASSSIGEIVAFGGGWEGSSPSSVVDVYNITSNSWFTLNLSQPRYELASTSSQNKIFFGGGLNSSSGGYSNVVDSFDISLPLSALTQTPVFTPLQLPQSTTNRLKLRSLPQ
jgi:hypothetical protein